MQQPRLDTFAIKGSVKRAQEFLKGGYTESITNTGIEVQDNFARLLLLDATRNPTLVEIKPRRKTWNYFAGKPVLTTKVFPDDLDTTSLAMMYLETDRGIKSKIMDQMLEYVSADGVIQVYFDHSRPRKDPVAATNVLRFFYRYQRGLQLQQTFDWVLDVLIRREYRDNTYYYPADAFLYVLSRFCDENPEGEVQEEIRFPLVERLLERVGLPGDSAELAMRALACQTMRVDNHVDVQRLVAMQCDDGGWEPGHLYKYGSSGVKIGNRSVVTAWAVKAVQNALSREY